MFLFFFLVLFQDVRSPMSSVGGESDDSSGPDSPSANGGVGGSGGGGGGGGSGGGGGGSSGQSSSQVLINQNNSQSDEQQTNNLIKSNLCNVLYPSALANLSQDVLMNLVQSGHLQIQTDEGRLRLVT